MVIRRKCSEITSPITWLLMPWPLCCQVINIHRQCWLNRKIPTQSHCREMIGSANVFMFAKSIHPRKGRTSNNVDNESKRWMAVKNFPTELLSLYTNSFLPGQPAVWGDCNEGHAAKVNPKLRSREFLSDHNYHNYEVRWWHILLQRSTPHCKFYQQSHIQIFIAFSLHIRYHSEFICFIWTYWKACFRGPNENPLKDKGQFGHYQTN